MIELVTCHDKINIRGLRYSVEMILDLLAADMSQAKMFSDYTDLETQDITAALEHAAPLNSTDRQ